MTDPHDLLERLCDLPGVAGFEGPVREAVAEIVAPFVGGTVIGLPVTLPGRTGSSGP